MQLVGIEILDDFQKKHADAAGSLKTFKTIVEAGRWASPQDVRQSLPKVDFVKKCAVFDICWNKYRILARISYKVGMVAIVKIGTHAEYDRWDLT